MATLKIRSTSACLNSCGRRSPGQTRSTHALWNSGSLPFLSLSDEVSTSHPRQTEDIHGSFVLSERRRWGSQYAHGRTASLLKRLSCGDSDFVALFQSDQLEYPTNPQREQSRISQEFSDRDQPTISQKLSEKPANDIRRSLRRPA